MRQSRAEALVTEEPDEGNLHVRICGGIGWQQLILPGSRRATRMIIRPLMKMESCSIVQAVTVSLARG